MNKPQFFVLNFILLFTAIFFVEKISEVLSQGLLLNVVRGLGSTSWCDKNQITLAGAFYIVTDKLCVQKNLRALHCRLDFP